MNDRDKELQQTFTEISAAIIREVRSLVEKNLSDCDTKNFLLWLLREANPYHQDYVQLSGINKLAQWSTFMLQDFPLDKDRTLISSLAVLNSYFVFEVTSDNLAIGLASQAMTPAAKNRKDTLILFNKIMQDAIRKKESTDKISWQEVQQKISRVSLYDQHLSSEKLQFLADQFLVEFPEATADDIQFGLYNYLMLNKQSCLNVVRAVNGSPLAPYLAECLIQRYEAVNSLLTNTKLNLSNLLEKGAQTILVEPTLLYLISLFDNKILFELNHNNIQLLLYALHISAMLVRLQNDLGSNLLIASQKKFKNVLEDLKSYQKKNKIIKLKQLDEFLSASSFSSYFFRLHKDLFYGEFNIALANLNHVKEGNIIELLTQNIIEFRNIYLSQKKQLAKYLSDLTAALGQKHISDLINKMVFFHEELYKHNYDKNGEYAID